MKTSPVRVLVACEFSGAVRDALINAGVDAVSCDIEDSETEGPHIKAPLEEVIDAELWTAIIAFPPYTHLCSSGARWWREKGDLQRQAIEFVEMIWSKRSVTRICIENPVGALSTRSALGRPSQIIQPWQFGHGETKATCLWLSGLPKLKPTDTVPGRENRIHRMPDSVRRQKERSRTYAGIASAMANQWKVYLR